MKKATGVTLGVLVVAALALAIIPATRDEIHWRWASHKDDTASYKSYVKTWPAGRHTAEAHARCDEHYWTDAKAANTIRAFRNYATEHPEGQHLREAEAKAASLRTDDAPFEAALQAGTEASLKQFVAEFPGHQREQDAQQALKDITEGSDLFALLKEKKIEIETQGSGIERVGVRMRKLLPYPITVRVPVGTYFVSSRQSAQNMVTTAESKIRLTGDGWRRVSVSAACANRPRDIPGSRDTFTVHRSPHQAELARLMPVLDKARVPYAVRQAAVWIVTDNADYGDLGILVSRQQFQTSGGTRQIREFESAKAMKICDEAGIDITRKAIWRDLQRVLSGLKDDGLKKWLEGKRETVARVGEGHKEGSPYGRVRLRVLSAGGESLKSFTLSLMRYLPSNPDNPVKDPTFPDRRVAPADFEGDHASIFNIPEGHYVFQVMEGGHAKTVSAPFQIVAAAPPPTVEVPLSMGAAITGTVLDDKGLPLAGAKVETDMNPPMADGGDPRMRALVFRILMGNKHTSISTLSNATGEFRLAKLAFADYMLRVSHPDYCEGALMDIKLDTEGQEREVGTIQLMRGSIVEGTCTLGGSPGAQMRIVIESTGGDRSEIDAKNRQRRPFKATAIADSEGHYRFSGHVPPGDYVIYAYKKEGEDDPMEKLSGVVQTRRQLKVQPGQERYTQNLALKGGR